MTTAAKSPPVGSSEISVASIENGTVIDHISAGKAILLMGILKLEGQKNQITVGINLPSSQMGLKDLIKVSGWELTPKETSQIAVFSPHATVNIIQNYQVVKKYNVEIPSVIETVLKCPNSTCITNHEKVATVFYVFSEQKKINLQCKFCEWIFSNKEIIS